MSAKVGNKSTGESFSTQLHCALPPLLPEKKPLFVARLVIIVVRHKEKDAAIRVCAGLDPQTNNPKTI